MVHLPPPGGQRRVQRFKLPVIVRIQREPAGRRNAADRTGAFCKLLRGVCRHGHQKPDVQPQLIIFVHLVQVVLQLVFLPPFLVGHARTVLPLPPHPVRLLGNGFLVVHVRVFQLVRQQFFVHRLRIHGNIHGVRHVRQCVQRVPFVHRRGVAVAEQDADMHAAQLQAAFMLPYGGREDMVLPPVRIPAKLPAIGYAHLPHLVKPLQGEEPLPPGHPVKAAPKRPEKHLQGGVQGMEIKPRLFVRSCPAGDCEVHHPADVLCPVLHLLIDPFPDAFAHLRVFFPVGRGECLRHELLHVHLLIGYGNLPLAPQRLHPLHELQKHRFFLPLILADIVHVLENIPPVIQCHPCTAHPEDAVLIGTADIQGILHIPRHTHGQGSLLLLF